MNKINKILFFTLALGCLSSIPNLQVQAVVNPLQLQNKEHNYFQNLDDDNDGEKPYKDLYTKILAIPGMIDYRIGVTLTGNNNTTKYVQQREVQNLQNQAVQQAINIALTGNNGTTKYVQQREVQNLQNQAVQQAIDTALAGNNGTTKYVQQREVQNLQNQAVQQAINTALTGNNGTTKYVQQREVQNLQNQAVQNAIATALAGNNGDTKYVQQRDIQNLQGTTEAGFNIWHHGATAVVTLILALGIQGGITYYLAKDKESTEGQTQEGEQDIVN